MTDNALLKEAQDSLSILTIRLRDSSIFIEDEWDLLDPVPADLTVETFNTVEALKEESLEKQGDIKAQVIWHYGFTFSAGIRLVEEIERDSEPDDEANKEDRNKKTFFEVRAKFCAKYFSKEKLSQECLLEFAKENVAFNSWPYWREYVQSTCGRVGLNPPLELPFYFIKSSTS